MSANENEIENCTHNCSTCGENCQRKAPGNCDALEKSL